MMPGPDLFEDLARRFDEAAAALRGQANGRPSYTGGALEL